ncbi:MAG: VanZ family protein [Chitinophagales bacterium]
MRELLRRAWPWAGWRAGLAWTLAVGVAVLDEWVQGRIPWRTELVSDVFLDVGAAALAIGLVALRRETRRLGERMR